MCKPKNRIMCPDCGKQKMLFESEAKAINFIKWNKDNIKGGDQLRAYYCPACCGWHISHQKYSKNMEGRTDKLIEAYKSSVKTKHEFELIELYEKLKKLSPKNIRTIDLLLKRLRYSKTRNKELNKK